jgi:dTDP-4-dehydrorhamnose reductase
VTKLIYNYDETYKLFEKEQPDFVIHLAAYVGGIFLNMKNSPEKLKSNHTILKTFKIANQIYVSLIVH